MSARPATPVVSAPVRVATVVAVVVVAVVAAIVSFSHMQTVALRAGEGWRSWLFPASVDGLIVAASMVLLVRRRAGVPGGWLAWVALLGGVVVSLACNVAAAQDTVTARLIAAWPPLAFAGAFELLLQQTRRSTPVGAPVGVVVEHPGEVATTTPPVVDHPAEPVGDSASGAAPDAGHGAADPPRVGEGGPGGRPLVDRDGAPGELGDPLVDRVVALVVEGRQSGRPVGRRTVARELQISEHRAAQLLASTNGRAP